MRKHLLLLAILALMNSAAAPATAPSNVTPWGLIQEAGRLPATDSPETTAMEYKPYPPYPKEWWDMTWDSEQQNGQIFSLLRQSRLLMEKNGGNSGTPVFVPAKVSLQRFLMPLNPVRTLANIMSDAALFSHLNGNDSEATARLLDYENIARCLRQGNIFVDQLVAIGIDGLGCENINIIAPTLRITPDPAGATTRKQTIQLLREILDEASDHDAWRKSFACEIEVAEHLQPSPKSPTTQKIPLDPADVKHDLPLINQACEFENFSASMSLLNQCHLSKTWLAMDRLFITQFRILADRRMSAVNLAIELYRADHNGSWPKALDALVPNYLPAVPRDMYRADNAPIGYKIIPHGWPDGHDRPVLFVDAGPDFQLNAEPRLGFYRENKKDVRQYRDLTLPASPSH